MHAGIAEISVGLVNCWIRRWACFFNSPLVVHRKIDCRGASMSIGTVATTTNIKQIALGGGTFGPREVEQMTGMLSDDPMAHRLLREAVSEMEASEDRSPAAAVRLGVCYFLLGRYAQAIETLKKGDGGGAGAILFGAFACGPGTIRPGG